MARAGVKHDRQYWLQLEMVNAAMLLLPFAHLPLVDHHHVFQNPQRHEAVRLGLVLDEDIQDDSAMLAADRWSDWGLQHQVGFEMAIIAADEAARHNAHLGEVDTREKLNVEQ